MNSRVEGFATQFETVNDDLIALVAGCSDEQWRQTCANESRPIGVVAHHVAATYPAFARIVGMLADGESYSPKPSWEDIHQSNARQAEELATVGKPETLDALRERGAAIAQQLRRLDDAQLDRIAGVFGEHELSVARVVEYVVIGHTREHLATIRATLPA